MTANRPAGEVAEELWQRLLAEPWPLPLDALPAGTALVGGAVRDGLLGRLEHQPDLDVVVPGDALALARQLARAHGGSCVVLDAERSIARLVLRGWTLDLARQEGSTLEADLGRRDFTINAIALPLPATGAAAAALVDPTGGLTHLQRRQLVAVSEANLLADPLRLLRGIRLALCSELEADLPALLLLLPQAATGLLERWRLPGDPLFHPKPPIDGRSLQRELAIPPGPQLGRLLEHLTLERAFGRLAAGPEARAEALAAAQHWWLMQG